MEHTQTLVDENGLEFTVTYEETKGSYGEEGHGYHEIEPSGIALTYCELVIAGKGINITPLLDQQQSNDIIYRLSL